MPGSIGGWTSPKEDVGVWVQDRGSAGGTHCPQKHITPPWPLSCQHRFKINRYRSFILKKKKIHSFSQFLIKSHPCPGQARGCCKALPPTQEPS